MSDTKLCTKCNQVLDLKTSFKPASKWTNRKGELKIYYHPTCRTCENSYKRERYKSGHSKYYHLAHTHNTRAKKLGLDGRVSEKEIKSIFEHTECYYCAFPNTGEIPMHVDHVVPLSDGGEHTLGNLVLSCQCCNMAKLKLSEDLYRKWLSHLKGNL